MHPLIPALLGAGVVAVLNVAGLAYFAGRVRQRLDDLPAVLNGTLIRDHEARCHKIAGQTPTPRREPPSAAC